MRHLSCQLFELARLEHGAIKPQLEQFSVCELIQDVAQKFELSIETRRLQLRIMMSHSASYQGRYFNDRACDNKFTG